ncbi:nitroreductase family protein [candidate division KSB1 bacterium]
MHITLIELLQSRKASRAISQKKLDKGILDKLMNAAQLSASCFNKQPWRFLFITDETILEKARKSLVEGNSWAKNAPLLIAGFSKIDLDCQLPDGRSYYLFDLGMAVQLLLLQATELDLIARPMAGYNPEIIKKECGIPEEYEVYVLIAVGFEGDIMELDEKLQERSKAPRKRNPIIENFYLNEMGEF